MATLPVDMALSGTKAIRTSPVVSTASVSWAGVSGPISSLTFDDTDDSDESKDFGDGFSFSLVSGANYTDGDTGLGGEYMGYAGARSCQSRTAAAQTGSGDRYLSESRCRQCVRRVDSRRDDAPVANHAALVYWGEEISRFL